MKKLIEKVVLVTGASKGIGAIIAQHVSAEGAKVVINYSGSDTDAEQVVNSIISNGGQEVIDRLAAMNPFNRIGEPEEIAKVVVFLASDDAKWINTQNIGINGGMA